MKDANDVTVSPVHGIWQVGKMTPEKTGVFKV